MTDEQLQLHMQKAAKRRETAEREAALARLALMEYAREARRRGWTYRKIAGFVGVTFQRLPAWMEA